MPKPLLVIPLMGKSLRFANEGVTVPKWALRFGGRPMLSWALDSLSSSLDQGIELRLVAPTQYADKLDTIRADLPWPSHVTYLSHATRGQAESVLRALDPGVLGRPLWIFNCDSRIEPGSLPAQGQYGNSLVCAKLKGEHWSFVKTSSEGHALEVAEKVRISEWCSTGFYAFESGRVFRWAYENTDFHGGEAFVAPMYNALIQSGSTVSMLAVAPSNFSVFGTPQELREFCRQRELQSPVG